MAVTTKKTFPNAVGTNGQSATVFTPVGIELNNHDDLDVYVTLPGGTRVLQLRQTSGSTAQSSHPQVNNTDGLYFPAVSAGTTLYNYTLSTDNNTITFSTTLPTGAVVSVERRTRDASGDYTNFAGGSTIRSTDLNNAFDESNFTAQEARNKALLIEGAIFNGDEISPTYVTSANIVDGTIVDADINANAAIQGTKIDPYFGNQTIATTGFAATGTLAVTGDILVTGNVDGRDVAADGTKLDTIETNAKDDQTSAELKVLFQSDKITDAEIATGTLDNRYFTETELNPTASLGSNVLDARYYTEDEAEAKFLRQDSSETIASGDTWSSSDSKVATTAAIDLRVIDLIDDVGGFDIIQSEQHFPNTNPQGTTGQSSVLSIKAATTDLVPSGTTVTITNGNVANNADITITGVTGTIPSGFGFLVESTTTQHTYAFHRLVPKATEVSTVAANAVNIAAAGANVTDIHNFADLYQISDNAPTQRADGSNLNVGDLWFDSSSNKVMMVYDASSGDGFAATTPNQADLAAIRIVSGQITFTEDLGLITEALTTATGNTTLNTVAGIASEATTVAGIASDVSAVAADATDIGVVAGKETEIGRLGTADAVADMNILGTTATVSDMDTLADISSDITTVAGIIEDQITLVTTVINSGGNKYVIDGDTSNPAKELVLYKGWTYIFDQSDSSNANHPLVFKTDSGSYTTNVTVTGTAGQAGAKVEIVIPETQPTGFRYYCSIHGNAMGNLITVKDDPIKTVSDNISNVLQVAAGDTNVGQVAANATNINAVAGKITEIGRLGTADAVADLAILGTADAVADMNTLGTAATVSDMDTLADISSDITTVAGLSTDVQTVAGNNANVTAVAGNNTNISAVANNSSNINSAVANETNINSAVSNASNINNVASNASNINTVAGNNANVTTVAGSIANVNTVSSNIGNVNTVASNVTDINSFSNRYRIASSAPTTNNDEGDLYFDTTSDELRVYNGSSWQGGVTATGNLAGLGANTFTGDQTVNANIVVSGTVDGKDISALGITGTTLDNGVTATTQSAGDNSTKVATTAYTDTAITNLVDSSPSALNTLNELAAALGDDANFSTTVTNSLGTKLPKSGGQMTGNITFSGSQTVDGRDLSADGAKLDGIAAGATNVTNTNQLTNGAGFITSSDNISGNAATSTKLANARTIAGVAFDGTQSISLNNANITNGANYITSADGGNAASLDGIDSTQFVRSDANDTLNGQYTISTSTNEKLILAGSADPYIRWQEGTTNKAYIVWNSAGNFELANQETGECLRIASGSNGLEFKHGGTYKTVWHSGNDGAGSGLSADTVDGYHATSFLRSDADDNATGTLTLRDTKIAANYHLQRSNHHSGHLEGSYNNVGANSTKSNPIYSIGSSYNPSDAALENMYGIGYTHTNASFINFTGASGWGMYVASDGDARVWLDGSNGVISSTGNHYVGSNRVLTTADEGSGNGLDADLWDGNQFASYLNQAVTTGSAPTFGNIYNNGWFRNNQSGQGLYNQATGQHFYSDHDDYWNVAGGTSANGIRFRDNHALSIRGYVYANNSNQIGFLNTSGNWSLKCDNSGNVTATGNVTAYSDARLKTNVKTIDNALDIVDELRGVSFDWKESGKHSIGVIAQEVEKVLPELVLTQEVSTTEHPEPKEVKSVDYGKMVGVLINAIKELKAEVKELKGIN